MKNSNIWQEEEKKFIKLENKIKIPNEVLQDVDLIELKTPEDFEKIPKKGGCYWILTNEPIKHAFHSKELPKKIGNMEIIYNGLAKDNIQDRIKKHLHNKIIDEGWSAISIDILLKKNIKSHRKKAMCKKERTSPARINRKFIRNTEDLLKLHLSPKEKKFINENDYVTFYFRNGINIFDEKHKKYLFKVYFIAGLKSSYPEFIEKKWRKYGRPRLCTYISGR